MEENFDISINKAVQKCKAQKGCHVFWTYIRQENWIMRRMKEQLSRESPSSWAWKAPLKTIQSQALLRAKPSCPRPHISRFWTSPMVDTPSQLWTTCSGTWLLSQCNQKMGVLYCFSLKHYVLLCHWLPLRRVCLPPLHLSIRYLHTEKIPKTFSSPGCTVPACSASPHSTGAPNTSWLWWPLPAEHSCHELRSPEVDTALQRKPWPAGKALPNAAPEAVGLKSTLLVHGQHGAPARTPWDFFIKLLPSCSALQPVLVHGVRCKTRTSIPPASVISQHKAALAECLCAKDQAIHSSKYMYR